MAPDGDLVATRLARGCRCFAAWSGGEIAGYGWVSTGPEWIGEIELELAPGPREAYVWNCVTLPAHRRRGVFSGLLIGITAWGRGAGLSRLWIGSVAIPAEKAVRPAGFSPVLEFQTASLAGARWLNVSVPAGADRALVAEGQARLSVRPGSSLRRSRRRRH